MSTIPLSAIVDITPGVLAAGGNSLDLNGLFLTTSPRVPIGTVKSFSNEVDVANFFGSGSTEDKEAQVYFDGFDNSDATPGALMFAQYPETAVSAYLRGGDLSDFTLSELQAITAGTLNVTVDGYAIAAVSIDLSGAASFSAAAAILETDLNAAIVQQAAFTGSITGNVLTVSAVSDAGIGVGQILTGAGITAGTVITSLRTGTGGVGTYNVNNSQTVASEAITSKQLPVDVSFDSFTSAFVIASTLTGVNSSIGFATGNASATLKLTSVTGAVISQGADAAVPGSFMAGVVQQSQNWATFQTLFDPDNGSGNDVRFAFAQWANSTNKRFAYVCEDDDITATTQNPAVNCLGQRIKQAGLNGTFLIWNNDPGNYLGAFGCDIGASIDFTKTNGRTSYAFRSQAGLVATVTDQTSMDNLIANGYNFYGAYGAANQNDVFLYPGSVSGEFLWMDSYINQIWLNSEMQIALLVLLRSRKSLPYNAAGYSAIEAAEADPINNALSFGAIRAGVPLSASQTQQVNQDAGGISIGPTLTARGWYLQILDAPPNVRQARGSPPINFWYVDGESINKIEMTSVVVQ